MKVVVVIPWRSHPSRVEAFEKLLEVFKNNHPQFEIVISDSGDENFSLAKSRNAGAKKAIDLGADVIIFNDADLFALPQSITTAVSYAVDHNEIVAPYTEYFQHENSKETRVFLKRLDYRLRLGKRFFPPNLSAKDDLPRRLWPCSGCIIVPKHIFLELGGFEEKIVGWGPEDTMFHRAYFDKYGKLFSYITGIAHSTFNDPTYRGDRPENQAFKDLVDFKDKRS
jgi:predicted glycosyltransferase involved in capsule biosynthesis